MYYVSAFLFSYLDPVIFYLIGFLRMGCALIVICFKIGGESLRPFQRFRPIFCQDLCVPWRKVSSKSSCSNHEILLLDLTIWVVVCGLLRWEEKLKGFFRRTFCVPTLEDTDPIYSEKVCAGLEMKRKTTATRSRSSLSPSITSTVTTSSKPSQPDPMFRYSHLKTIPDHQRYLRHFGYCLRHYGYFSATVAISWVIVIRYIDRVSSPILSHHYGYFVKFPIS
ncbi:hypothetical protein C5167_008701 [Papaver somniferum]|uniref:Uncharacterized protein n=1 Tax=Papaver somniferum TaxID=3469 RepID=A0A4Y7JVB2_PAPSO|nr:uncharacterized protein LOC113287269 [Papaver somniferum]RZC65013.1 hypothetical protein C5167_008701 [Papaver somniferum]